MADNKEKMTPVVSGAKVKKKSGVKKLTDSFIAEDVSNVKDYLLGNVLIPAAKKTIQDLVTNGIDMILFGEESRSRFSDGIPASKVSFRDYNKISSNYTNGRRPAVNRSTYSYDDITVPLRGDAEAVLQQMDEALERYGFVTVADYYDLLGITGSYTDNKYGWTDLRSARVVRVRDGYTIHLPRTMPID